ncbi:MAG: hypothetical protein ACRBFS_07780 [Aureispira sp.]
MQLRVQLDELKKRCRLDSSCGVLEGYTAAVKSYITMDETYEAEIGLALREYPYIESISINNQPLEIKGGKAIYQYQPSSIGERKMTARIVLTHPNNPHKDTLNKEFTFAVGNKQAAIQSFYPNTLYTRQENIIHIASGGIPSYNARISAKGGGVKAYRKGNNSYVLRVSKPKEKVEVRLINAEDKTELASATYYVKNIRDLVLETELGELGRPKHLTAQQMQLQKMLTANFKKGEYDGKCWVYTYTLEYTPKDGKKQVFNSTWEEGWRGQRGFFKGNILKVIQQAKSGDRYKFTNIRGDCKGIPHAAFYQPNAATDLIIAIE